MARSKKPAKAAEGVSSPRKSLRHAPPTPSEGVSSTGPNKRKPTVPARCTRCDGRPLRAQCVHTKLGREYILSQEALKSMQDAIPNDLPPPLTHPGNLSPPRQSSPVTSPVPPPESSPGWAGHIPVIDPLLLLTALAPSTPGPSAGSLSNIPATPGPPEPTTPSSLSHPASGLSGASQGASREGSCTPTPTSKRIRATAKHPIFKHVKGVLRDIYRKHARPSPIASSTQASKAFLEKMNSLVELSEDISIKTGAWLFVGAQHPGATGGAINYSSPRLRRDGGERTDAFATSFLKLVSKAAESKRLDTLELQKNLEEQQEKSERLQRQLDSALASESARSQELALFREKFGSFQGE